MLGPSARRWLLDWGCCHLVVTLYLGWLMLAPPPVALAGELSERLAQFPQWQAPPSLQPAEGPLIYPDWFLGDWRVTSTLVDLAAPLAPDLTSPGFAEQRKSLNHPIQFDIRFTLPSALSTSVVGPLPQVAKERLSQGAVADQAYNSMNLAIATLGNQAIRSVTIDPHHPNHQITLFAGERQLTAITSQRKQESDTPDQLITSELFQQIFSAQGQLYLNQVENTTAYYHTPGEVPEIEADQVTAVYLSPQNSNYFQAGHRPVALYRYHLILTALQSAAS